LYKRVADIPEEVSDKEVIVRGVCSPHHLKDGKLVVAAYHPTPETDEVSVMRHDYMGSDACKAKAKELENPVKNKVYEGLAVLSARQIRSTDCEIKDSRQIYPGHADIKVGIIVPRGEPLPPEVAKVLLDRKRALLRLTNYFPDPDPQATNWTGEKLFPRT
jgi:hypothetical protein